MNLKSLIFSIICFLCINFYSHPLETLVLDDFNTSYPVWNYLEYYEDKSSKLKIEDVIKTDILNKFVQNEKEVLNFGYTKSSIWIKLKVKNNSSKNNIYIIELMYPFINNVDLYFFDDNLNYSVEKNGLDIPFNKRALKNKAIIFNLKVDYQDEKEFYLKIKTNFTNHIILNIYNEKYFYSKDNKEDFMLGIYYGIMFIILIINIIILLIIREKSYLYYCLFFLCTIIIHMYLNKIISEVFPYSNWYGNLIFYPFTSVGLFFVILFTNNFLIQKINSRFFTLYYLYLKLF